MTKISPNLFYGHRWSIGTDTQSKIWQLAQPGVWQAAYAAACKLKQPRGPLPVHHPLVQTMEERSRVQAQEVFLERRANLLAKAGCSFYPHAAAGELYLMIDESVIYNDMTGSIIMDDFASSSHWAAQLTAFMSALKLVRPQPPSWFLVTHHA